MSEDKLLRWRLRVERGRHGKAFPFIVESLCVRPSDDRPWVVQRKKAPRENPLVEDGSDPLRTVLVRWWAYWRGVAQR